MILDNAFYRQLQRAFRFVAEDKREIRAPSFADNECKRGYWLSARGAIAIVPHQNIGAFLHFEEINAKAFAEKCQRENINVQFAEENLTFGHGHVKLYSNLICYYGNYANSQNPARARYISCSKNKFGGVVENGIPRALEYQAMIIMALTRTRDFLYVFHSVQTGQFKFIEIKYDEKLAMEVWETANAGVESADIPPHLPEIGGKIHPKCADCEFSAACLAPEIPAPTCRACRHVVLGPNGYIACGAQNNFNLSPEMILNLHKCEYHRYNAGLIATWAQPEGRTDANEWVYSNLLNGGKFVNGSTTPGAYSSYQMNNIEGNNPASLVGDDTLNKLIQMFDAKLADDK